jgi:hypothetical protein
MASILEIYAIAIIIAPLAMIPLPILKIHKYMKSDGHLRITSALGFLVFLIAIAISRLLFYLFDFVITEFDMGMYMVQPAPSVYKAGNLAFIIGISFLIYSLDAHYFQLRMKGIVAYCFLSAGVLLAFIPISSFRDFTLSSGLFGIVTRTSFVFLIVVSFVHGGIVARARLGSFLIAIGFIVYFLGIIFTSAYFVSLFVWMDGAYAISGVMHCGGLALGAIGILLYPLVSSDTSGPSQKE